MCGIFGWVKFQEPLTDDEIRLSRRALESLSHRGPDATGELITPYLFLGHKRLSIIDLSDNGRQPFEYRELKGVFNGEIYNYIELRQELIRAGVQFRTSTDVEVLFAAFSKWGVKALSRFNGMFAAGIHNQGSDNHFLFRDHLGQKPLYYFLYDGGIVYASEFRAIANLTTFPWVLDYPNFLRYLANGYYAWDSTPVQGIKKLLPGHYIAIHRGNVSLNRFWDSVPGRHKVEVSLQEATEGVEALFDESCAITLRADVNTGIFLSGGVDSSLVLSSCARSVKGLKSFSVSMGESDFDERQFAQEAHSLYGDGDFCAFDLNKNLIQDVLVEAIDTLDEPQADPGFVNNYFIAKMARKHITVALSGAGGDELFYGYLPFKGLRYSGLLNNFPKAFVDFARVMAYQALPGTDTYAGKQFKALSFLGGFPSSDTMMLPLWLSAVTPEELNMLALGNNFGFFSRSGERGTLFDYVTELFDGLDDLTAAQKLAYFYQKVFLPEFICSGIDRASMRSSIEVRCPFLSVPLVEYANSLNDKVKMNQSELKVVLKNILHHRGSTSAFVNRKKQGFTFPLGRWLKTSMRPAIESIFEKDEAIGSLINKKYLGHLWQEHLNGRRNNYRILYNVLVFKTWYSNFNHIRIPSSLS